MVNDGEARKNDEKRSLAQRLAKEVGISEDDALALVDLIGSDWNSLVREARFQKDRG